MSSIKGIFILIALIGVFSIKVFGQTNPSIDTRKSGLDALVFGAGTGLDYGGLGLRLLSQFNPNVGVFIGVGLWDGLAANAGLKVRVLPKPQSTLSPYVIAMYGRNEIVVTPARGIRNRISIGAGVDLFNTPKSFGYITLGANYGLIPQAIYFTIGLNVIVAKKV